jgi:uncharacterized membrane protein YedE/YeeE
MRIVVALLCGVLFGAGLALSDMINPARVLGFLDVAGHWDPTLAFVMGGALIPAAVGFLAARRCRAPLLDTHFHLPESQSVDGRLLIGAGLFGAGWGLVGFCPGPALAALPFGGPSVWLFFAAMLAGMAMHTLFLRRPQGRPVSPAPQAHR